MNVLDSFSHGLISVLRTFAQLMLGTLGLVEGGLRGLMKGAGLNADAQTVLMIFLLAVFLVAVLRLLRGRLRTLMALLLILVLAHTLEGIARGSLG